MNVMDLTYQLGLWAKQHPDLLLYSGGGFLALVLGASLLGNRGRPAQTTHGSARWATPREIRAAGLTAPHGVVLGRLGRQILRDDSETHDLVLGPSRSGKGVGPMQCTLFTWRHSALIYDPANGENYEASQAWRTAVGHQVERFTPRSSPHTCLNVCDLIRFGTPEEFDDALVVGDSLVSPMKHHQSDAGRYFRGLAKMVIAAGLLHLHYTAPPVSLGKLGVLLTQRYPTLGKCLEAIRTAQHTTHGGHPSIAWLVQATSQLSDRSTGDAWGTVVSALLPYADLVTQRSTDTSTITIDDLQHRAQPMSLYLVAPSTRSLDTQAPVYRVVSDMIQYRLQQYPPRSAQQRLLVIADEAPAFGYSSFLDKGAAEAAKYGIKLLIVAQDTVQIDGTFGKDNNIFGNTATKLFFAPDQHATAEALSRAWGQATVEQPVLSQQQGLRKQASMAYQQVGRALLTADELRAMHPQAAIIDRTGLRPILAGKVNGRTDPEYREQRAARAASGDKGIAAHKERNGDEA